MRLYKNDPRRAPPTQVTRIPNEPTVLSRLPLQASGNTIWCI